MYHKAGVPSDLQDKNGKVTIPNNMNLPRAFDSEEIQAVNSVIESGFMSRYSSWDNSKVYQFEKEAAKYLGVEYTLMVNSGTSALNCCLIGLEIGPGDEVIVPCFTWISDAAAVTSVGAVPVFAEIDETLGLSVASISARLSKHTKAIIVVHMMGIPCNNIKEIVEFAHKNNIFVIEDCAQSVGAKIGDKHTGTFGDAGFWSLNYHKNICVGEGGLVITNSRKIYERSWSASEPAFQEPHSLGSVEKASKESGVMEFFQNWETEHLHFSAFRASEISGALGIVGLSKLDSQLSYLRKLRSDFLSQLEKPINYDLQIMPEGGGDCGNAINIILKNQKDMEYFLNALKKEQINTRAVYTEGTRDSRIYLNWDSLIKMKGLNHMGYPWKDPNYLGKWKENYNGEDGTLKGLCPTSLHILSRTLTFSFSLYMKDEHVTYLSSCLNKIDASCK